MMSYLHIVIGLTLSVHNSFPAPLDNNLPRTDIFRSHQMLDYDSDHLLTQHKRLSRRSMVSQHYPVIIWSFNAYSREFRIHISPNPQLFTKDFSVETDADSVEFDRNRAYVGHTADEVGNRKAGSHVAGVLLKDGRFEGKIMDDEVEYYIERAEHYLTDEGHANSSSTPSFHSIIYRMEDVKVDTMLNATTCKFEMMKDSMSRLTSSDSYDGRRFEDDKFQSSHNGGHKMYSREGNRVRRAVDHTKTMCELYIQADHFYYQKWGSNVDTVIELLTSYVQAANGIYKDIDFDGDGVADDITFAIKKLKVWTDASASSYPFANNLGVNSFLEVFSEQDNFDSFCLAYTFSHRDFNDGTLGLAWPGSVDSSGGVCAKYAAYVSGGTAMSLNTGIVTTLNFQQEVIFSISHITFAHELGHNLGSPHDDETSETCAPGDSLGGNYIMYPKATDGDKLNNNKFSSCSISIMNDVMNVRARHDGSDACFKVYSATQCGNKVVEEGEDCDCGWDDECDETCCNPQMTRYDPLLYTPCTYTNYSLCSPSEGACCGSDCQPRSHSEFYECRASTSCTNASICDGTAICPDSLPKANGTDCADGMVCYAGECSTSVCQAFGYEFCQCTPETADDWNDERLCKLCCLFDGTCTPSVGIPSITRESTGSPGQPCFEYQGYCDVFLKCRKLDPVGAINGVKNLLLSEEGQATITEWVTSNWYIVAASILGFVILLALVVKFGAKHEPVIAPSGNKISPE